MATLLSHVVPWDTSSWERTLASEVQRLLDLGIPIKDLWNAERCPESFLPYLAWALSVDLWDTNWPIEKKRAVTKAAITDQKIKGTEALIRRYVQYMDGEIVQLLTRPQGLYVDGATPEMVADYLAQMPQLRVYLASLVGERDQGLYYDEDFLDAGFYIPDRSSALYGRISTMLRDGVETPLQTYTVKTSTTTKVATDFEQVIIPGEAYAGLFCDDGYLDVDFLDGSKEPKIVSYYQNTEYEDHQTEFPITYVRPGLKPQNPRYDRVSKDGNAGLGFMLDEDFCDDERFYVPDNAEFLVFDRLYLFDSEVLPPDGISDGFLDDARLDMPAFTAEMLIEVFRTAYLTEMFLDADYVDEQFVVNDNLDKQSAIMDAIASAKSLRDRILVAFDTRKTITFGDIIQLDGSVRFDQTVRRYL
jgi:phage tail P2-like protein